MTKKKLANYLKFTGRRLLAAWIDFIIVMVLVGAMLMAVVWSYNQNGWLHTLAVQFCAREEPLLFLNACVKKISPWVIFSTGYLAALFFSIIYAIVMTLWQGRTVGKILLSLEIVDRYDHQPGLYTLLSREIFARFLTYAFPIIQLSVFAPSGNTIIDKFFKLRIRIKK